MSDSKGIVLIVEDQFLAAEFLRIWVEAFGFDVCGVAATADAAVDLAQMHQPTHVLMDVRLEGEKDGVDAAIAIAGFASPRIVFCTGSSEASTVARINAVSPFEILFKPIDPKRLADAMLRDEHLRARAS